jgi:hypothetical protein
MSTKFAMPKMRLVVAALRSMCAAHSGITA